jgi:hypothetical protein
MADLALFQGFSHHVCVIALPQGGIVVGRNNHTAEAAFGKRGLDGREHQWLA